MNFTNQVKTFFGFSPQKDQQDKYKARAKANGLMSILELSEALQSKDEEILNEVLSTQQLKLSVPCSVNFAISKLQSQEKKLVIKDQIIFDNSNFHGIVFDSEELLATVQKLKGQEVTLNVNHSRNPEHFIGYFSNAKLNTDNQITADIEIDLLNPSFFAQKYAIENGVELGFSIEVSFDWDWDFVIKPTNAEIYGLATTMIPSAPATLTEVDTNDLEQTNKTIMDTPILTPTELEETATPEVETTQATDSTPESETLEANIQIAELNAKHSEELSIYTTLADSKDETIAKLSASLVKTTESLSKANTALKIANQNVADLRAETIKLRKPQSFSNF
jgi:hypothetical protein